MSDVTSPGSSTPLVNDDRTVALDWYAYFEALGASDDQRLTDLEDIVTDTTVNINGTIRPSAAQVWYTTDGTAPTGAILPGDFWQRTDTGELRILRGGTWETVTSNDVRNLGGRPVSVVLADLDLALTNAANSASDGVLTPGEKVGIIPLINQLRDGRATLAARAVALGVSAALADYSAAMNALDALLTGLTLPVAWNSMAGNTTVADPADFVSKLSNAGRRSWELQAACDGEAARRSEWTLVTGRPNTLAALDSAANVLLNNTNADGTLTRNEVIAARGADTSLSARFATVNGAWANGDSVLAGQITAVSATVQGRPNLLPNSTFEDGSRGWVGSGGVTVTATQLATGWSALVTGWGTGYRELRSPRFAVTGGQTYTISGRTAARHASSVQPLEMRLRWLDSAGAAISFSPGRAVPDNASMAAFTALTVTAPATATQAEVVIVGQDITVPSGAPFAYVYPQRIKVELGSVASMWTDEGQVVSTTARVQELFLAEADLDGRVSATWGVYLSAGGQIAGFRAHVNGVTSALDFDAAAFRIWNGSTGIPPFEVVGGVVYIQTARIRNLTADNLVAGAITSGWGDEQAGTIALTAAWQTAASVTITNNVLGGNVRIDGAFQADVFNSSVSVGKSVDARITRNGIVIWSGTVLTCAPATRLVIQAQNYDISYQWYGVVTLWDIDDAPPQGSITYALQVSGNAGNISQRRIFAQLFRR